MNAPKIILEFESEKDFEAYKNNIIREAKISFLNVIKHEAGMADKKDKIFSMDNIDLIYDKYNYNGRL